MPMKVLGPLSATSVAIATASSPGCDAFSANLKRRSRPPAGLVTSMTSPTALSSTAIARDESHTSPHVPLPPAQRRAEADAAAKEFYRRSNHPLAEWSELTHTDPLLSHIRSELITKFIVIGRTQSDAEVEVDAFLSDEERSGEYIEMRWNAWSQRDENLGFEDAALYASSFLLGVGADLLMRWCSEHIDGFTAPLFFH